MADRKRRILPMGTPVTPAERSGPRHTLRLWLGDLLFAGAVGLLLSAIIWGIALL